MMPADPWNGAVTDTNAPRASVAALTARERAAMTPISAEDAADALNRAAVTVNDPGRTDHGRTLIHCLAGATGMDWCLEAAVALVRNGQQVAWGPSTAGHELYVLSSKGRIYAFEVKRPASQA